MSQENHTKSRQCICNNKSGFFVTNRQASSTSAMLILFFILVIVVSYIWGQRRAIQEFTNKMVDDSFADKINYSYYSLYGGQFGNENEGDADEQSSDSEEEYQEDLKPCPETSVSSKKDDKKYYAELVGFGSAKSAQQFYNRCAKRGQSVKIKQRQSRGSKGKVVTWYQVITDSFSDKSKLEELANKIKKYEHLNQVKVVTVDS